MAITMKYGSDFRAGQSIQNRLQAARTEGTPQAGRRLGGYRVIGKLEGA
jgi:hypothetical protein